MKLNFLRMRIRDRLILGFAALCFVLAVAVGMTLWKISDVSVTTDRMVHLRVPTAAAGNAIVINVNGSLAALRGYVLTAAPQMKSARAGAWAEINDARGKMDQMAAKFTNQENVKRWHEVKPLLAELEAVQGRIEAIVGTPDAFPATRMLLTEGAPRVDAMVAALNKMIDEEGTLAATPERKALLKAMADTRGSTALAAATLRGFLATGESGFKDRFGQLMSLSEAALGELRAKEALLSASQRAAHETLIKARQEFVPIAQKIIELRAADTWNQAVYLLRTEAAPRAEKISTALEGPPGANGQRVGGLIDNQSDLLNKEADGMVAGLDSLTLMSWVLLVIGLALGASIALLTARAITRPVNAMTGAMTTLASGDTSVEVPARERADEIGEMAKAVQVFKDSMIESDRMRAEQAKEQEAKERRAKVMEQSVKEFEAAVTSIVQGVSSAATELQTSAQSMSATAEETSRQSTAVAAASEQASTNVQTVASAAEELSSSIAEISRQVSQSSKVAGKAVEEAAKTNTTVQGLAEAAQKIGDVVKLINDIAGQTNLLALNATIEAARAGEAGKGFAVVASEVKSLANQTAKATDEIAAQINAMQGATEQSVEAIKGIGTTIAEINEIATTIAAAVEEQGAATMEIARNVQQASAGTSEVSSNIAGVTQASAETGAAASQVLGAASELAKQSAVLSSEVDKFVTTVRAA